MFKRLKVLIVDDNADVAESLCVLLTAWGHDCRTAANGEQAILAAREVIPDVVLMDILMPIKDGIDAARELRAEPFGKGIMIVAISAWVQNFERALFETTGFDFRLQKPVEPAALAAVLARDPE